ncbi:MAG: 50S ribosomal protein L10 [Candidatus Omnitrophota bacterium]|nr:MAG: 50S ribosomal protein L10 [Candidatus Omnitrophota bacterium]
MSKVSAERKGMLKEIIERISSFESLLIGRHDHLKVEEMEELREKLSTVSGGYFVVKNKLFKLALKKMGREVDFKINGQTGVCYGPEIEKLAKVLVGFKKKHTNFDIQGGIEKKGFISSAYIEELAALPSREVMIAEFLHSLQSPLLTFLYLLKEHIRRLLRVIEEISKKKEGQEK